MGLNLTPAMKMLVGLVAAFALLNIGVPIYSLIVGATAQTALAGTIDVPVAINTSINASVTSYVTGITRIQTAGNFVIGLASLVTLIAVFAPMLGGLFKKKEKKGNTGGFM